MFAFFFYLKENYNCDKTLLDTLNFDEYSSEVIEDWKMVALLVGSPKRFYQVSLLSLVFVTAATPRRTTKGWTGQSGPISTWGGSASGGSHWWNPGKFRCHHCTSNWVYSLSQLSIRNPSPSSTFKTSKSQSHSLRRTTDKEDPGEQGIPQEAHEEGESGLAWYSFVAVVRSFLGNQKAEKDAEAAS